jgi:hypothetical protein
MSVYILESDDKFQNLSVVEDQDWEVINKLDGTPQGASWKPLKVEVYGDDGNRERDEGDFVDLAGLVPIFSCEAAKRLKEILRSSGEFLTLACNERGYVAFNVTDVIDALNVSRSEIVYFPSGRVLDVKRFVLNLERLSSSVIFKIPQIPLGRVFVTDLFVNLVHDAKLRGFQFKPVEVINGDV